MSLIEVARLGRPHGLRGEMTLSGATLAADEMRAVGEFLWRDARGRTRTLKLESVRGAAPHLLVRFEGILSREAAAELTNGRLFVEPARLPDAGSGRAYAFQLVGLEVRTEDGRTLGVLEDILQTGANPVYVIRGEREWLVPATEEVVRRVDLPGRTITVALPPGLEDV
jgi:16S rRNA processing protein RimM